MYVNIENNVKLTYQQAKMVSTYFLDGHFSASEIMSMVEEHVPMAPVVEDALFAFQEYSIEELLKHGDLVIQAKERVKNFGLTTA